jgi:sporulation protein YlmC with PRC-barrel domain
MERDINSIIGFSIAASDGVIGKLEDFYFDYKKCKIKYLIIRTKTPLNSRKVLISPVAVLNQVWQKGLIPLDLTAKQINQSPDIDTDRPVSLQQETELYGHYAWRNDVEDFPKEKEKSGTDHSNPVINKTILKEIHADKSSGEYLQLCSTARITNYVIYAKDGQIGKVNDFVFDDQTWQLLSIVADTTDLSGGRKVLIGTTHITVIDWTKFEVFLDILTAEVEALPLFKKGSSLPKA